MSPPKPSLLLLEMVEFGELFLESPSPSDSPGSFRLLGLNGRDGLNTHTQFRTLSAGLCNRDINSVCLCRTINKHILVAIKILIESWCVALLLLICFCIFFCREAILGFKIGIIILALLIALVNRHRIRAGSCKRWSTQSWDRVLDGHTCYRLYINSFLLLLHKETHTLSVSHHRGFALDSDNSLSTDMVDSLYDCTGAGTGRGAGAGPQRLAVRCL